ncbi:MAG: diguanylate cyclase (GGDEF)-like protein/PAS domain S-box-containing protein [Bermanella sp.]|jgi:diguanylate cyclase (GGDEF)-like protein/PAS domain S-box-containing protein
MANVEFYKSAAQKDVLDNIKENLAPSTSISIIETKLNKVIFSTGENEKIINLKINDFSTILENIDGRTKGNYKEKNKIKSGNLINSLAAIGTYPNWNWVIISYIGNDQLYQYMYEAMSFSLTLTVVCLFFLFIGVYQLSNNLSHAIVLLQKGAQRLSKNNFDMKIDISGNNEFSSLANSFNIMGQEIKETQDRLTISILEEQRVNQDLKVSEQRQAMALLGADLGLWDYDLRTNRVVYDERWCGIIGLSLKDVPQNVESWMSLLHPDDAIEVYNTLEANLNGESPDYDKEFRMLHKDGHWVWIYAKGRVVERDEQGAPLRMTGTHMDISLRKHNEISLHRAASVFKHSHESILITGLDGRIIDVNDACLQLTGYSRSYLLGKNQQVFRPDNKAVDNTSEIFTTLKKKGYWYGEILYQNKAGEIYTVKQAVSSVANDHGEVQHYVSLFSDITESKKHQQQLEHLANFDVLTDLPNRAMLSEFLQHSMEQEQRRESNLAVIYLDLDGFKLINDRHGHKVGDQLLITLASRMKAVLRKGDLLSRIGGDEFVAVLVDLEKINNSEATISRLLKAAASPIVVDELELKVSASLGVSFYPQVQEVDADQVLRQADQAMYQAKISGKNGFHIFDSELDRSIRGQHENIERIFLALERREFILFYQPKVNMRTGQIVGVEALIRWKHPERGLLTPGYFLPVIENHSLAMISIGEWVTDTALTQMEKWKLDGLNISVSVNIDALHLQQSNFIDRQRIILAAHPLVPPFHLEMEILETSELDDVLQTAKVINACKELGVSFALDDFGTGYSSLTYLRRLDVRLIKIDQTFVRDMLDNPDDLAIIQGVISLASALKRDVIAEGVETVAHGSKLLELGCELAQGYGIAKPMSHDELPNWCENWHPDPSWTIQK